jgi:hypothetical protein
MPSFPSFLFYSPLCKYQKKYAPTCFSNCALSNEFILHLKWKISVGLDSLFFFCESPFGDPYLTALPVRAVCKSTAPWEAMKDLLRSPG